MNILITGSSGFLGKHLMESLSSSFSLYPFDLKTGHDILNPEHIAKEIQSNNCEKVIHLAALADLNQYHNHPKLGYQVNIIGTENVLRVCNETGTQLYFASTCCAYGNNGVYPSNESAPLCPTEAYAESKVLCEKIIRASDQNHVIFRLATFYGPGMRPALAPAIFIDRSRRGLCIPIHGSGLQSRTFTYITDITEAIKTVLSHSEPPSVVNISSSESRSVLELAHIVMETTGVKVPVKHIEERSGQVFREEIDNSVLASLGFRPGISLEDGIRMSLN